MRSNLFMSCIHFIMLSQEDGCCPLEPKQHQLQTHQTHPISGSHQYHSAAHIDTNMRHSTQQALRPSSSGACPASPRAPGTCPHPRTVSQTELLHSTVCASLCKMFLQLLEITSVLTWLRNARSCVIYLSRLETMLGCRVCHFSSKQRQHCLLEGLYPPPLAWMGKAMVWGVSGFFTSVL